MVPFHLPDLSLDLCPPVNSSYLPDFLSRFPVTGNWNFHEVNKLNDVIYRLEDELGKIHAFKRELPLSYIILNDAIEKLKEKAKNQGERKTEGKLEILEYDKFEKKSWMSSVQLWSPSKEDEVISRESQLGETGVFSSFKEDSRISLKEEKTGEPELSLITPGLKSQTKPVFNQTARKQRRCWSPELHRRFVEALERLGGSQVATPKQIRELMQVDGLTNDEVKSHLQKYRLHVRKLPSSKEANHPSSSNTVSMGQDHLELSCSKLEPSNSGSPEGPLHLARAGKYNSASMEEDEDEEKSDGQSWKVQQHMLALED